jgi:uncharacterized membrane protein (DUF2068 family)
VTRLHLDPENRLVHAAAEKVAGIDQARLRALGAGSFFYALLESVEGVGLIRRRHWAEYLTVIATGSLLPLEVIELSHKISVIRVGVFLANIAILVYLLVMLRRGRKVDARGPGGSDGL